MAGGLLIYIELLNFCKKHIKRLALVAGIVSACYLFFAAAFVVVALTVDGRRASNPQLPELPPPEIGNGGYTDTGPPSHFLEPLPPGEPDDGSFFRPPARTNFVLLGIDNIGAGLADAIMVGTFYRDSGEVRFMSVPRDTHIVLSDARHTQIRALGLNVPRQMKINELRAYGGGVWGAHLLIQELNDMLGIRLDYYIEVRLPAFRRIVNAIGGVHFNVPRRMYYFDPEENPPLRIDLQPGPQLLMGQEAEWLVRYRETLPNNDLGRNQIQMQFMTALLQQVMTREAIMSNPLELARVIIEDVNTNMTLLNAARYLPFITSINTEGISTFTMPGTDGWRSGAGSVFIPDLEKLHEVTREVFYAHIETEPEQEEDDDGDDNDET
ncbi:MAG: LCP family protein [Defluviitaleaceae bacterium]|nr:LCP family protein [Defluviitaleaceae bacterium]